MRIRHILAAGVLCGSLALCTLSAVAQGTTTRPTDGMTPAMQAHMRQFAQDALLMAENTAVWVNDRLVVLQGNRLLQYSNDLTLVRTVELPLPSTPTPTPAAAPGTATTPPVHPLPGMLPTKLIPISNGDLIVIRGMQVLRLGKELEVLNTAILPALPPLTTAEVDAICPLCGRMPAAGMGMGMSGRGMHTPPVPTTMTPPTAPPTPPATPPIQ